MKQKKIWIGILALLALPACGGGEQKSNPVTMSSTTGPQSTHPAPETLASPSPTPLATAPAPSVPVDITGTWVEFGDSTQQNSGTLAKTFVIAPGDFTLSATCAFANGPVVTTTTNSSAATVAGAALTLSSNVWVDAVASGASHDWECESMVAADTYTFQVSGNTAHVLVDGTDIGTYQRQ